MQLEALSDRLLSVFKEASLDLGKILATKGLNAVSNNPKSVVCLRCTALLTAYQSSDAQPALLQTAMVIAWGSLKVLCT